MPGEFDQITPETSQARLVYEYNAAFKELGIPVDKDLLLDRSKPIYNHQTGVELITRSDKDEQLNRELETAFLEARDLCLAEQLIYDPEDDSSYLIIDAKLRDFTVSEMLDSALELRGIKGKIRAKHFHDVAEKLRGELTGAILDTPGYEPTTILGVYANDNGRGSVSRNFTFSLATGVPELRHDIQTFAETLTNGGNKIIKNGEDISEQVSRELTTLVSEDEAFALFDEYMRGIPKPVGYLFSDIDDLPKDEKKQFYTGWAKLLEGAETLMIEAAKPDTQIADLVEKLKKQIAQNPTATGHRAKWALETVMLEIVKTKVRLHYKSDFEENGDEVANILLGFKPKAAIIKLAENGSVVMNFSNPDDFKRAIRNKKAQTPTLGVAYFNRNDNIRSLNGSVKLIGPQIQPGDGAEEHEDCHRINNLTISGLQYTPQIFSSSIEGGTLLNDRIRDWLASWDINFQDEIIAFSVMAKTNPNASDFEKYLVQEDGLYDNLQTFYMSLAPRDAFQVAFVPAHEKLREHRNAHIHRLVEIAKKTDDINLLRAVPIHEWEEVLG